MVFLKEYSWRIPHRVDAQVAGEVMEKIEQRDGVVTKESFLDESRPESSPTHVLFEWNDAVAAEKYRLKQSQKIITDLQIKVIRQDVEKKVPAVVKVTVGNKTKGEYVNTKAVMQTDELRKIALQNALADFKELEAKYESYVELDDIFKAIHNAERMYG